MQYQVQHLDATHYIYICIYIYKLWWECLRQCGTSLGWIVCKLPDHCEQLPDMCGHSDSLHMKVLASEEYRLVLQRCTCVSKYMYYIYIYIYSYRCVWTYGPGAFIYIYI